MQFTQGKNVAPLTENMLVSHAAVTEGCNAKAVRKMSKIVGIHGEEFDLIGKGCVHMCKRGQGREGGLVLQASGGGRSEFVSVRVYIRCCVCTFLCVCMCLCVSTRARVCVRESIMLVASAPCLCASVCVCTRTAISFEFKDLAVMLAWDGWGRGLKKIDEGAQMPIRGISIKILLKSSAFQDCCKLSILRLYEAEFSGIDKEVASKDWATSCGQTVRSWLYHDCTRLSILRF